MGFETRSLSHNDARTVNEPESSTLIDWQIVARTDEAKQSAKNRSPAQQSPAPESSAPTVPKDQANCPASPEYQQVITKAARAMFDPQRLGDLTKALNQYNCEIKSPKDALAKADVTLRNTGDRFNHMILPDGTQSFEDMKNGKYYGVGISFKKQIDSPLKVTEVKPDGPAEKSGVKVGDQIQTIDGKDTTKMSNSDVVTALRGADKSLVKLTLEGNPKPLELNRVPYEMPPEVTDPIDQGDNIAYIRLKSFDRYQLADELQKSMEKQPGAKAYVIDLRGNGGGLINSSVEVASIFLESGVVYNMSRRKDSDPTNPQYTEESQRITPTAIETLEDGKVTGTRNRHPNLAGDKPVVVLTDGASASASEMLIGALDDNGRITKVGLKTFGKGIGQNWYSMPEGSLLYVTSSHITSPHKHWYGDAHDKRYGLDPDITVDLNPGAQWGSPEDNQLAEANAYLRRRMGLLPK